jgi:hypothetical protein
MQRMVGIMNVNSGSIHTGRKTWDWDDEQPPWLRDLVSTVEDVLGRVDTMQGVLGGVQDDLDRLGEVIAEITSRAIDSALESFAAELKEYLNGAAVAYNLEGWREKGYEFFCIHAESFQDDPEIAEVEERLFALASSPLLQSDIHRNRSEISGWFYMTFPWPGPTVLTKDVLLDRSSVLFGSAEEERRTEPMERLWPVLSKDADLKDRLRRAHFYFSPEEMADETAAMKRKLSPVRKTGK